jgi:hypothetical protein
VQGVKQEEEEEEEEEEEVKKAAWGLPQLKWWCLGAHGLAKGVQVGLLVIQQPSKQLSTPSSWCCNKQRLSSK